MTAGGMIILPAVGPKKTLFFGCFLYTVAPLLTYACLVTSAPIGLLYVAYGMFSSFALNIVMLVCLTLPVTWFPHHRGKVIQAVTKSEILVSIIDLPALAPPPSPNKICVILW